MVERHSDLLGAAARLYERYRRNGPRPFNIFTVLRSASDEVNLHSRFLHALLNHVDPLSDERENLKAFLRDVAGAGDFAVESARVERESNNVDLLVSNGGEAVVIENKIWADDQHLQLQRYRDMLVEQGYDAASVRLLYLTPFGHEPSDASRGSISEEDVQTVSYQDDLPNWLAGCQRRAVDEPALRESIAQYLQLIRRLTNNDYETEHMRKLKELLLRGDNVVLAREISNALVDAEAVLVREFYDVIDRVLHEVVEDLPELDPEYAYLAQEPAIKKCIGGRGKDLDSGLHYGFADNAWLCVGGKDRLWFGVECHVEDDADLCRDRALNRALAGVGGRHTDEEGVPWSQWLDELPAWESRGEWLHLRRGANEPTLRFLSSGSDVLEVFARDLARAISELWMTIKKHGLAA